MILFPWVNHRFNWFEADISKENRVAADEPILDINHLDGYPEKYEKYYQDDFGLRSLFIQCRNQLDARVFQSSPVPKNVLIGKDGWYYARKSYTHNTMRYYNPSEREIIIEEFKRRKKWCDSAGVDYYVAVVPNKMTIYPEHLPWQFQQVPANLKYEESLELLKASGIQFIDVKSALLAQKNRSSERIFQKTDDHWNDLGAYCGYQSIMQSIQNKYPELAPISINEYKKELRSHEGNMTQIVSMATIDPEYEHFLIKKNPSSAIEGTEFGYQNQGRIEQKECEIVRINPKGKKKKCLIIRDSFTLKMIPFFKENFEHVTFFHDEWNYRLNESVITQEQPDIVITVILESHFVNTYYDKMGIPIFL